MLVKMLALQSLTYAVAISGSMAAHVLAPASAPRPGAETATFSQQIVNRPSKGDPPQIVNRPPKGSRLQRAEPVRGDRPPFRIPTHCKPPVDVLGRCFAAMDGPRMT